MKKKTLKKNPSNRKPISYSTEFRLDINLNNFVKKLCPAMINAFQAYLSTLWLYAMARRRTFASLASQDTFCYTFHL